MARNTVSHIYTLSEHPSHLHCRACGIHISPATVDSSATRRGALVTVDLLLERDRRQFGIYVGLVYLNYWGDFVQTGRNRRGNVCSTFWWAARQNRVTISKTKHSPGKPFPESQILKGRRPHTIYYYKVYVIASKFKFNIPVSP